MIRLEDGYLVSLPREEAKSFFGCRSDEARLEFLQDLLQSNNVQVVNCRGVWSPLHNVLTLTQASAPALPQCLLGGRSMHNGDDHIVCMVRPDVVRNVAEQCGRVDEAEFRRAWGESENDLDAHAAWLILRDIAGLYHEASETGAAVVFVARAS